jgi:PAS domain S-box-containing protein
LVRVEGAAVAAAAARSERTTAPAIAPHSPASVPDSPALRSLAESEPTIDPRRPTVLSRRARQGPDDEDLPEGKGLPDGSANASSGAGMKRAADRETGWLWATLTLSSASIVAVVFALWELLENRFFRGVDYVTLHSLYITRGVASSLLLASWAAWYVLKQKRRSEAELRRSREHYRSLLEASPGALALYDSALRVFEWNATAERLYGYRKDELFGRPLPTVLPERQAELRSFLERVASGQSVLDVETQRVDRAGNRFDVQLTLLPFRDLSGRDLFLEATSDIRERVRLRQAMLEIEKLASMGQMAAGTAHHLNTPLATMLLRVQMMRDAAPPEASASDLQQLESGIVFCQNFVRRLLDFSRRPAAEKQPQQLSRILESVTTFLAPSFEARRAKVTLDLAHAEEAEVLADRNLLEALFSILLANSVDAIAAEGTIAIRCLPARDGRVELEIEDDGCGIEPANLERAFEPFFTTKGPGRGTGLGLAIARNILFEVGGSIRLESVPGKGTKAILELPLARRERPAEVRAS